MSAGARGLPMSGDALEVGLFLTLGTSAAEAVAAWHEANKLHGRICPEAFYVDAAGIVLLEGPDRMSSPALAYLAPEQTGRLGRAEDARTDLYSLGVVLYELATGSTPFRGEDALEWVHCHLARPPRRPSEVVGALAGTVEGILLRLLAKLPEERYQTARGLAADLGRCRASLRATGRIAAFEIGLRDQSDRLEVSQRLRGRKSELKRLAGAVDAVAADGRPRLICVAGEPGVGKSAMINAIGELVAVAGGRLLAGKFAPGNQNGPYATFAEVTDQLVGQLLAESDERLAAWRVRLTAALGDDARALVDLAPSWSLVLGDPPAVAELPAAETRQRVYRSVRRLIEAVTEPRHPLVLAFDDLQWAQNASLEMISQLLRHPDSRRLLVVGSYRSNEVGPDHPLTAIIAELREHGVAETVTLGPLPKTAIAAILADTIHASRKHTLQLAHVVTGKTGGNPLFASQFVHRLNELGLLTFDQVGLGWVWDLDRVRQVSATDNVVELVAARMSRLGPKLRRLLEAAALLGVTFDLGTISQATGREPNAIADDLVPVLRQGLIGAVSGGLHVARSVTAQYRWSHDRVRQAALGLIAPEVMPRMHLALGRALQSGRSAAELEDQLFEVVEHLNAAGGLMSSFEERTELATLNLAAGRRAKRSGAPAEARSYFVAAMEALPADAWTEVYDLAFPIHCELAEAEHVAGKHERTFELLDAAFGPARTVLDRVELRRLRVVCLHDLGDLPGMFRYGLEGLELLGIEIPEDPKARRRAARAAVAGLGGRLSKLSAEDILRTPPASDPTTVSAGNFIAFVLPPATTDPDLLALLTSRSVELALDHGFTGPLAYALALHAIVTHQRLDDDDACRWCMDVALGLVETLKAYEMRARVNSAVVLAMAFWYRQPESALALLWDGYLAGIEAKDPQWAIFDLGFHCVHAFALGAHLDEVAGELDIAWEHLGRYSNDMGASVLLELDEALRRLRGRAGTIGPPPATAGCAALHELALKGGLSSHSTWCLVPKLTVAYLFGDYQEALRLAEVEAAIEPYPVGIFAGGERHFYQALALTALYPSANPEQRQRSSATLQELQSALDRWAARGPAVFACRALLVSAERARVAGLAQQARRGYEQAIHAAHEHEFVHVEAIACELASKQADELGEYEQAASYIGRSRSCYRRWGARAKADSLLDPPGSISPTRTREPVLAGLPTQLDVLAVVKATHAFSEELELDKLLATMLELLVQHAGAERGCLLLTQRAEPRLAAEAIVDEAGLTVTLDMRERVEARLPMAVLDYTRHTRQPVMAGDPDTLARFAADPYISEQQPKSLLCLPMSHRGELVALLYLEHRHLAGVFTSAHVELLEVLSTQAAISLENARIHTDLQDTSNRLRHRALHDELTDLANRALLLEHLRVALARTHRAESSLAVLYLDLDNFKLVNDSLGHAAGDAVLVEVARRLQSVLRDTDTAARLGGDEFVILCTDLADERQPHHIAQRLAEELATPFHISGTEVRVTASIGIALPTGPGHAPELLLRDADLAMYRAKQEGKDRYEFFNEIHRARLVDRLRVENELRRGVAADEMRVHYQPIFRLCDRALLGFEALVRWQHPTRGLLLPADFIEVAEESDAIVEIGHWVLAEACKQAVAWQHATDSPVHMGVNLSLRQLYKRDFPTRLARILAESRIDPNLLWLEVTESLLFDASASSTEDLMAIKAMGAHLGIDDFGTGYSSLSYLKRLPVSFVKVDRSFVSGLGTNAEDSAIVEAVIRLAQALDLHTIAEGIETAEQLAALTALGCTYGQGYYVSCALPPERAQRFLRGLP